ncbi:MAG: HesA/MoeB/ThiF family protein [Pseudomonadota bacterium]
MSDRYPRQEILAEVGESGQRTLQASRVLVIGAGGLGCPALQYLAGAGVGSLDIVDADQVEITNLHRQPLYGENTLGQPKADAAAAYVRNLNPEVRATPHRALLTPDNAGALLEAADVALDCADSFAATYVLSDACAQSAKPLISASALGLQGYAGGFCGGAPSVRAVFPDLPNNLATCASAGVLGPVVGLLGSLQAQMTLQVLLRTEPSPLGQMVTFDSTRFRFSTFRFDGAPEPTGNAFSFIAVSAIRTDDFVVELRGEEEAPTPVTASAVRATVSDFETADVVPAAGRRAVLCCRSGLRAWRAAAALQRYADNPIALVAAGDAPREA